MSRKIVIDIMHIFDFVQYNYAWEVKVCTKILFLSV